MITLGILLTLCVGFLVLTAITSRLTLLEYLSLSFPVGMGIQTLLMSLLDWMNIGISASSISTISILLILACAWPAIRNYRSNPGLMDKILLKGFKLPKPNLVWMLFTFLIVWFEFMNFSKTIYFPTFDTDGIRGFDFVGLAVAHEGTLKNLSLFTSPNYNFQTNAGVSSYTPFAQLAFAYVYLFGAVSSKIVTATMYMSFVGIFYAFIKRVSTHTVAAIFTLMMMITPEMLAFSALSGINVLHTVFACSGLLLTVIWYEKKENWMLILSAILLTLNCYTRNEGIVFSAAASLLVLFKAYKKDIQWLKAGAFVLAAFFGFIYWNLFLKANNIHSGSNLIIMKPFWDGEKVSIMYKELKELYFNSQYYGITVNVFFLMILANVWFLFRKGDQAHLLVATLGVMLLYTLIIYQINYVWDSIENVLRYSYKRFFFSFIPLMWFYIANNHISRWLFGKADQMLYGKERQGL